MNAKEAKARAKAAKAYAIAQRPLWKKKRVLIPVAILAVIVGAGLASSGGSDEKDPTPASATQNTDVSKGIGSKDASADVKVVRLEPIDAIGIRRPVLEITNNSSKRSNYIIELALESSDGKTQYDTTTGSASNVDPGQTTGGSVIGFTKAKNAPADAVVKIKSVSRTAA
jgi:hypothetical protein